MYERPQTDEYAEYYGTYISKVPDGDVLAELEDQLRQTHALVGKLDDARGEHRYADDKWSIKEVIGHIADTERVFCIRALAFARQDPTELPGFDQDSYVRNGYFASRTLSDCVAELDTVRAASLSLFRGLDERAVLRQGRANKVLFTVRSVPWILAGHSRHHLGVLRQRYL